LIIDYVSPINLVARTGNVTMIGAAGSARARQSTRQSFLKRAGIAQWRVLDHTSKGRRAANASTWATSARSVFSLRFPAG